MNGIIFDNKFLSSLSVTNISSTHGTSKNWKEICFYIFLEFGHIFQKQWTIQSTCAYELIFIFGLSSIQTSSRGMLDLVFNIFCLQAQVDYIVHPIFLLNLRDCNNKNSILDHIWGVKNTLHTIKKIFLQKKKILAIKG